MDLTKQYPRSVHHKMQGIVQLARTTDKAQAVAHGNVGDYHYNCSMDQAVFEFLGIDHAQYLNAVKNAKNDGEIERYAKQFIDKKTPGQLEEWNRTWVSTPPTGESLEYMTELRQKIAPGRDDLTTWADVLDFDEGRDVPRRIAA